jgi:ABC-type transport system involved in multi-copper enzyme maturation permease subunit
VLKDVRLLRWLLAAWLLVLLLYHGVAIAGLLIPGSVILAPATGQSYASLRTGLPAANMVLGWLGVAAFVVLCASFVQADSPASSTAFWLTRPISGRTMVASKLLVALVVLMGLPLALDVLDLLVAGSGGPEWRSSDNWSLLGWSLATQLVWLLPLLAIAAVTDGLAQFVLIVIFEVLTFGALVGLLQSVARSWLPHPEVSAISSFVVFVPALLLVAAIVLAHAYLTRRHTRSVVMVAIAPVFLVVVVMFWPWWPLGRQTPARPAVGHRLDATSISIGVDPAGWRVVQRSNGLVDLVAMLTITGLPRDTTVNLIGRGWLTADSTRLAVSGSSSTLPYEFQRAPAGEESRVQVAPDFRMTIGRGVFDRVKGQAATLQIDLTAYVSRTLASTVIPLAAGATYRTGAVRGEVLDVARSADGLTVAMRETAWSPYALGLDSILWALRDASGRDVIAHPSDVWIPLGWYEGWLPIPRHLSLALQARHFDRPPGTTWSDESPRGWQIIVIRRAWMGQVSKTVYVPDLRLDALPGASQP